MKVEILNSTKLTVTKVFLAVFYLVGLVGLIIPGTRWEFQRLIPLNLLITALLMLSFHEQWKRKDILIMAGIVVFTFVIELVGVNTNWLFGNYTYGIFLGVKLGKTPLIIGVNWLVLTYCIYSSLHRWWHKKYVVFIAAAMMVVFDWVMEPVAMKIGMWNWESGIVPFKNYLDWFLVSLLVFIAMNKLGFKPKNKLSLFLILTQLVFFACLNLFLE